MTPEFKSAQLASGLRLPYVEQGEKGGTAVVLLHAYVDSWRTFELVLPHLPPSIHAFAPDQRGHGDADRPDSGYELEQLSADVAEFMDAVGLDAAVIVGSSSGGYVAQRFALDFPHRVSGLVLIGNPLSLRERPPILDAVLELSDPVDPAFVREFVGAVVSQSVPPAFLETMIAESQKVPAHVWKAALLGLQAATPPTETGTITAPTVIIWGDRDEFLPRADQEALAAAIPKSQLVVYEGAGHVVLWEQPERIAADIVALAERIQPPAERLSLMPTPLIEFPADDPERARRFWQGLLGAELEPRPSEAGSGWEFDGDGLRLGLHERGTGPGDTASLPYFTVPEIEAAMDRVRELGGSIIHPGERWAICRDSEGSPFALAAG